jgi:hypothetical protein
MNKVSIQSQIAAVELAISSTTLRGSQRDLHIDQLRAVAQTLRFVRSHDTAIRALVEKPKGGAA